ncbi:MAG: alpha/beta fold hydrolase [Aureliella sp.]
MLTTQRLLPAASYALLCYAVSLSGAVSLGGSAVSVQAQEATAKQELWYGVLDADVRKFRFLVELNQSDGAWSGKLISLDEGRVELQLDSVSRSESQLAFDIKATSANYSANLDDSQLVATGKWKQRTANLELAFKRVEAAPREKLKNRWTGQIKVLFQKINVAVRELESGDVLFDSLSQKAGGFVAKKEVDGDKVKINVPAIAGKFEGTYNADKTEMTGNWSQGLVSVELVLTQDFEDAEAEQTVSRPQTPQAPFPYAIEEVTFHNDTADINLAGTLTLPRSDTPSPAVILISGSGPQDRDESIADHKPFWVIADHLSRRGIAVLRFDDRGVGKSEGDFAKANSTDFATDAQAAVEFLRSRSDIDSTKIGLCGHSEGGLIAPMVASEDQDLAFIILLAGPGVNGEQILLSQGQLILKAAGASDEELQSEQTIQRILLDLAKREPALSKESFIEATQNAIKPHLDEKDQARSQQIAETAATQLLSPWFRYFLTYEPAPTLQSVSCSVLALNGELDVQVAPNLNLPAIRAALQKAPTEDFEIVELKGLNHLFQNCTTGGIEEYQEIEETFAPKALDTITDWILARTR